MDSNNQGSDGEGDDKRTSSGIKPSCLRKVLLHVPWYATDHFEAGIEPLLLECRDQGLDIEFVKGEY